MNLNTQQAHQRRESEKRSRYIVINQQQDQMAYTSYHGDRVTVSPTFNNEEFQQQTASRMTNSDKNSLQQWRTRETRPSSQE